MNVYPLHVVYRIVPVPGRVLSFLPPTPPEGWPVPRPGDVLRVPDGVPLTVATVEWDYSVPSVVVYLREDV